MGNICPSTFTEWKIARVNDLLREPRCYETSCHEYNSVLGLIHMIRELEPKIVLEVGSHRGVSTEAFLLFCPSVTAVSLFEDTLDMATTEFAMRCGSYPNLRVIKGRSPQAFGALPEQSFDLVYVDADHSYQAVSDDIEGAYPLVRPGGYLAGHDYAEEGVIKAVQEHIEKYGGKIRLYSDSSWAVRKAAQ